MLREFLRLKKNATKCNLDPQEGIKALAILIMEVNIKAYVEFPWLCKNF